MSVNAPVEPGTSASPNPTSRRTSVGLAAAGVACVAGCSVPALATGLAGAAGAQLLGVPAWIVTVSMTMVIAAAMMRTRRRRATHRDAACGCGC